MNHANLVLWIIGAGAWLSVSVNDIDSITYSTGSSSTDMLVHTGRGTRIHSVARIDSILLGDRAVAWEAAPQEKHQYIVTANRVEAFEFNVGTWGPGWAWMNLGGEVSTDGGKRTVTGSKAVEGSDATVSFTHIAEQISPSTVSLSWDFTFDRAVDGLKFIVGPSIRRCTAFSAVSASVYP